MSDMLEKAIVDAEALKEAALKNAEAAIVEKYSHEIKEAVSSLLEQPEEDSFCRGRNGWHGRSRRRRRGTYRRRNSRHARCGYRRGRFYALVLNLERW